MIGVWMELITRSEMEMKRSIDQLRKGGVKCKIRGRDYKWKGMVGWGVGCREAE